MALVSRCGLLLGLLLAGCQAARPGGRDRLAQYAPTAVEAPVFTPELAADDSYLPGRKRPPVFGEEPRPQAAPEPAPRSKMKLGPAGQRAIDKIIWGATVMREWPGYEEHHLFPQQKGLRDLFEQHEVQVDDWAILIPDFQHKQAHRREGGDYGPGGKWNWDWEQWWDVRLQEQSAIAPDDIFIHARQLIQEHGLTKYGLPFQYGHGRQMSRDLYDIAEPPRAMAKGR